MQVRIFWPQVFLITQSVCSTLDDTDLVVQPFHETERDFVLRLAVSSDSIPMSIDHLSKLLIGFEALPLQAGAPDVHHDTAEAPAFFCPKPVVELRHAHLRTILTAEPYWTSAIQIAHHDAVGMTLANRDLIDADRLGSRTSRFRKLSAHVLLFQRL